MWHTSNCSLLLIHQPWKDERLSWPGWLTYSGWFTHISGHPSAVGRAQDRERWTVCRVRRSMTNVLLLRHATNHCLRGLCICPHPFLAKRNYVIKWHDYGVCHLSSVCLSVCRLWRSCTLLRRLNFSAIFFSPYGSPIILGLSASNIFTKFQLGHPYRSAKYRWGIKITRFSTNKSLYLTNDTR